MSAPTPTYLTPRAAARIARRAHAGQFDKSGAPYITHPARVAAKLAEAYGEDHPVVAVGWLHDVLEDTDVTLADLRAQGLSPAQETALVALTHLPHEPQMEYLARVVTSAMAVATKLADIADNTSPKRTSMLDVPTRERLRAKYDRARDYLEGYVGHDGVRLDDPDIFVMVSWDLTASQLTELAAPLPPRSGDLGELLSLTLSLTRDPARCPLADWVRTVRAPFGGRTLLEILTSEGTGPALRTWREVSPHRQPV